MQKAIVQHAVAERKNWTKFGQERGNKPGPDRSTTTVGENVALKLSAGNKVHPTRKVVSAYANALLRSSKNRKWPRRMSSKPVLQRQVQERFSAGLARATITPLAVHTRLCSVVWRSWAAD